MTSALLPGEAATYSNYTSYDKGINGIMIDIAGLPSGATLTASDFVFEVGNSSNPSSWSSAPTPADIAVRSGAGVDGSDRVEITWSNGSIYNEWLQVQVKPDANTGLAGTDVFYFGNAMGSAVPGSGGGRVYVNASDEVAIDANFTGSASITDIYDVNRDGVVDSSDATVAADHNETFANGLLYLTPPAQAPVSSYVTDYYDGAGRLAAEVDYGTTSESAPGPYDAVPTPSDTALVTSYSYLADNVQTLTIAGSPTGGSFTLAFGGQTTSGIAYNASASTVQSDLAGLSSIGSGNVSVIGDAGGPYTIRFIGSLTGEYQSPITHTSSLTGGTSPSVSDVVAIPGGDAGMQQFSTDPRGIVTASDFDMLGRTIDTIDAFTDGVPTSDTDQITAYTYDGNGDVLTMTAVMPAGTNNQTTAYIYGVGTTIGTDLFSNDLIAKTEYPDPSTGAASTSAANDVSQTYDHLGETLTQTDQNGSTHTFTYDSLGRLTLDAVTTLGTGVDGSVLALGYAFTALSLPYQQTSYSNSAGTTVVNQDQDAYNGLEQLTGEYQNVSGAVNTSTTPEVQYAYSSLSTGSLLTEMIYPNGRILHFGYNNSAVDTAIGRVDYLADDNGSGGVGSHLVDYTYQGLDTLIGQAYGNGVAETTTLDAFGDIADMKYAISGSSTDNFAYGYDRDGNVLYMDNLVNTAFSELYHANSTTSGDDNSAYDPLGRLTSFTRGTLSSSGNNGSTLDTVSTANSLAGSSQSWSLDAIGNQTSVTTDGTATSNTQNSQNELTGVGSSTLTYDNDGNMTTDQNGNTLTYDAWNRLVTDSAGTTSYAYDANGRRISETQSGTTTDFYLSAQDQVLEERQSGTVTAQNVWSIDYVNDLVLRDDNSTSGNLGISGSGLGNRIYYQHDANFNVTATTNTSGVVQQRFIYSAYGIQTVLTSSWGTSGSANSIYGFQGGRYDIETALSHFDTRDYSPSLAVWIEEDLMRYVNGSDVFQFLTGNPVGSIDPLGTAVTLINVRSNEQNGDNFSNDEGETAELGGQLKQWIDANANAADALIGKIANIGQGEWAAKGASGKIKWSGKSVGWSKQQYIDALKHDRVIKVLKQVKGGLPVTCDAVSKEKKNLDQPWDELGVFYHDTGDIFGPGKKMFPTTGDNAQVDPATALDALKKAGATSQFTCFTKDKTVYEVKAGIQTGSGSYGANGIDWTPPTLVRSVTAQ